MTYSEKVQEQLKGRTISSAQVDGDGITLIFTDESHFEYEASDGGYSTFSFSEPKEDDGYIVKGNRWLISKKFIDGKEYIKYERR